MDKLVISSGSTGLVFQVGVDAANILTIAVSTFSASIGSLAVTGQTISTAAGATAAITAVDTALNSLNAQRSKLGVFQTKLENVLSVAQAQHESYSTAIFFYSRCGLC